MSIRAAQASDPPHLKAAFADLGLSEVAGRKHNARVLEMFKLAGHPQISDDETAWCAAAVGAWLKEAGYKNTGSLMARSYAKYGRACDPKQSVPRGAIVVWPRGTPPSGHVNICLHDDGTYLTCIGGNQSNGKGGGVTISRDRKSRAIAKRIPIGSGLRSFAAAVKESKIAKTAIVVGTGAGTDAISTVSDTAHQVAGIKETADQIGITDILFRLAQTPRFWIAVGAVVAVGLILYWRWKDHA